MTAKETRYMELLKRYFAAGQKADAKEYAAVMNAAIDFDYTFAVKLWEFALAESEPHLMESAYAGVLTDATEAVFEKKNAARLAKTINESVAVRTAIYRYSETSLARPAPIGYLVAALAAGKTAEAEEILKCALKNASGDFGAFLLTATQRLIVELLKKNAKSAMPKKISALILAYADKIKGGEKALIYQRIRELG